MLPFVSKRLNQFLLILILFLNTRVLMLLILPADNLTVYGDYRYYFDLGRLFFDRGYLPFIHYWSEYSPLFPFLNLALYGLSGGLFRNYVVLTGLVLLLFETGILVLLYLMSTGLRHDIDAGQISWAYVILYVPLFIWLRNYDPIPAFFFLLALFILLRGRSWWLTGLIIGLGTMVKLFPILLLATVWWKRGWRAALLSGLVVLLRGDSWPAVNPKSSEQVQRIRSSRSSMMKSLSLFLPKSFRGDLLALFVLALLVRLLTALPQQQPNYMDAAYSYVNALNLVAGRGFVEDFVWIYLDNPDPPPHPSHLYWLPFTSILAWLGMIVGGATYRMAQVPFIIISALLAPITYGVTYLVSGQRRQSWLAGLLAIFSGFYFPFWTAIDNFTPFAVAGSLALLIAWRAMNNETMNNYQLSIINGQFIPYLIAAGVFVGLAHLSRADGFLLLIAIILIYLLHLASHASRITPHASRITPHASRIIPQIPQIPRRAQVAQVAQAHHASRITHHVSRITFYLLLGYAVIMTPWFIRNWLAVGTPLLTAGSQTIWLTNYDELFSYGRELSAQTFFAQGIGPVLEGRWWVLTTNLKTMLAVWGMIFLLPLTLVGLWHLRHHCLIQLAGLYALLLFITMTLIFAFPGARGGLFHSGTALLPFIYATAVVGLDNSIDWIAARRRHWDAQLAKQFFGVSLVVMAIALSSFIYYRRVIKNNTWNNADNLYPTIVEWVAQENPAATVMINNPPAYRYHGGGLSVVVPNENIETTLQVAHRYQVDYLILEHNHPAPLTELHSQTVTHPDLSLVKTFGDVYIFEIIRP